MSYRKEDHLPDPIYTCLICEEEYEPEHWQHKDKRRCKECQKEETMQQYECGVCHEEKTREELWVADEGLICDDCRKQDKLNTAWYVLDDLAQDTEMRTWEVRALLEARQIVSRELSKKEGKPDEQSGMAASQA